MRKHRLYGVVIAAFLGMGTILHRPSQSNMNTGTVLPGAGVRLASASLYMLPSGHGLTSGVAATVGLLHTSPHPASSGDGAVDLASLRIPAPPPPQAQAQPAPAPAPLPPAVTPAPPVPAGGVWAALRQCESGDNYWANTGNGYYGAYQFSLATWESLGLAGLPSQASPGEQDAAAAELQARNGWGQWPVCSQQLGLD